MKVVREIGPFGNHINAKLEFEALSLSSFWVCLESMCFEGMVSMLWAF